MPKLIPKVSMETFINEDGMRMNFDRESAAAVSLRSTAVDIRGSNALPLHPIGSVAVVGNSEYRYTKAGTAVSAGHVVRTSLSTYTKKDGLLDGAAAKGSRKVKIKYDDSAITADAYQYFIDGLGHIYWIVSHDALAAAGDKGEMVLGEVLVEEIPAATAVSLIENYFGDVQQHNVAVGTTPANTVLGAAMADAAVGRYLWVQTKGVASLRISAAVVIGTIVAATSDGKVAPLGTASNIRLSAAVGRALTSGSSNNDWVPVLLEL